MCCSGSAAPLLPLPLLSAVAASVSTVAGLAVEAVACSVSCLAVEVALQVGVASVVFLVSVVTVSLGSRSTRPRVSILLNASRYYSDSLIACTCTRHFYVCPYLLKCVPQI